MVEVMTDVLFIGKLRVLEIGGARLPVRGSADDEIEDEEDEVLS